MKRIFALALSLLLMGTPVFANGPHGDSEQGNRISGSVGQGPSQAKKKTPSTLNYPGPIIRNVERSSGQAFPAAQEDVQVRFVALAGEAEIDTESGILEYRTNGGSFAELPVVHEGNLVFAATIPGQVASTLVEFKIKLFDTQQVVSFDPAERHFYRILAGSPQIYDVREPLLNNGRSAYEGYTVSVEGIVSADVRDLPGNDNLAPRILIQDSFTREYSGLVLYSSSENDPIRGVERGTRIRVTGTISELNGATAISDIQSFTITGENIPVGTLILAPDYLTGYDENGLARAERWESMLITLRYLRIADFDYSAIQSNGTFEVLPQSENPVQLAAPLMVDLRYGNFAQENGQGDVRYSLPFQGDLIESVSGFISSRANETQLVPRTDDDFGELTYTEAKDYIVHSTSISSFPNPFAEVTSLEIMLAEPANAQILLYDLKGKLVRQIADQYFGEGQHVLRFESQTLPAGTYHCVLRSSLGQFVHKLVIER